MFVVSYICIVWIFLVFHIRFYTTVKVQNMKCNKMCGWYIILHQFLENSDSPSIVEQWSQKVWCSIITSLLQFLSWPCPMPYAWFLASCSMGSPLSWLFLDLAFPSALLLWIHWIASWELLPWGLWLPFFLGCPPNELWDSLSSLLEPWDSLSSFTELWLARCIVG